MQQNGHPFFQNRQRAYVPCHASANEDTFHCPFCYCPLYALGERRGGNFAYTEHGIKNCTGCLLPHSEGGYDYG